MINTIIFDLDGTLLNTLEDLKDSTNFTLSRYNYSTRTEDEVRSFVGNGVDKLIERAIPEGASNPQFKECVKTFKEYYSKNMYNKTSPYAGIIDLVAELNKNNYKVAVVSNKFDKAVKELCEKYFNGKIQIAIGESENVRKKPSPDSVLEVINHLGVKKEETVYVGDSEVDIKTARNAELIIVGVTWGFRSRETLINAGADYIIDSPNDLLTLIKKINIGLKRLKP